MRLWIAGVVVVSLMLVGGCCAPCHRLGCGLHHHYAGPGAVYGEEPGVVQYHPGPLSWLWRLLGIGRGYSCGDCGPRYWGDWGGDIAGCESCDDYGNWTGMPAVGPRVVVQVLVVEALTVRNANLQKLKKSRAVGQSRCKDNPPWRPSRTKNRPPGGDGW